MNSETPKTSEAQLKAIKKYKQQNVKRITVDFYPADSDLWDHIQNKKNKQGYIKNLIQDDMEKNG